jgi:hypothetical protein
MPGEKHLAWNPPVLEQVLTKLWLPQGLLVLLCSRGHSHQLMPADVLGPGIWTQLCPSGFPSLVREHKV